MSKVSYDLLLFRLSNYINNFDNNYPPVEYDDLIRYPTGFECDQYVVCKFMYNTLYLLINKNIDFIIIENLKSYTYNNIIYRIPHKTIDHVLEQISAFIYVKTV